MNRCSLDASTDYCRVGGGPVPVGHHAASGITYTLAPTAIESALDSDPPDGVVYDYVEASRQQDVILLFRR